MNGDGPTRLRGDFEEGRCEDEIARQFRKREEDEIAGDFEEGR
jgi:hypothetical protein